MTPTRLFGVPIRGFRTMLDEWLTQTLDDTAKAGDSGRICGGTYRILGSGLLALTPDATTAQARSVVVSAGIHGNETAPIELVGELLAALEAGTLRLGAPMLVILGNIPAIHAATRFVKTNLNRLFQRGLEALGNEAERAREMMTAVDDFFAHHAERPLHLDMHTAIRDSRFPRFAVVPYADSPPPSGWADLSGAGLQAVLFQHQHSWTFSHYSRHYHAAEAYTLELGKVRRFGENDLEALRKMRVWLASLAEGRTLEKSDVEPPRVFQVAHELMRSDEAFRLTFAEDVANFTEFPVGTQLSEDDSGNGFVVETAPLAVVFPNAHVELKARAALLVRECGS